MLDACMCVYVCVRAHARVCVCVRVHALSCFSRVWLFVTPWTVACQAPLSIEFSRQEYWSGLPCLPKGELPDQESNLHLLCSCIAGRFFTTELPGKPVGCINIYKYSYPLVGLTSLSLCNGLGLKSTLDDSPGCPRFFIFIFMKMSMTLRVIIDRHVLVAILVIVFGLLCNSLIPFLFSCSLFEGFL